jgi:hypothetical protein
LWFHKTYKLTTAVKTKADVRLLRILKPIPYFPHFIT